MKKTINTALAAASLPLFITGCLNNPAYLQQNSVLVSEVVSICGAMVGGQAEQRINQEWAKYPGTEASRPLIENMANALLTNPEATAQQRTSQYSQYLTCATGLLTVNQMTQ